MDEYQKKLNTILPIPDIVVKADWDELKIVDQAEKYCIPFGRVLQRCLEPHRIMINQAATCDDAGMHLARCISDVTNYLKDIQARKRLNSDK